MQHSDWEPSPGRYLVLLPVPASSGGGSERLAAQHARQALASLAAMFQRELRLAFRLAPVSHALPRLLAGSGAQLTLAGEPPAALVLHPRRGRFQVLPLASVQQAALRLEEVLDGGGQWQQAGDAAQ